MYDEFKVLGITYQTITKNANGVFLLNIYRINDMKRINEYFYDNTKIFLNRKKEIFDNVKILNGKYE
jgi:hypothetical protein